MRNIKTTIAALCLSLLCLSAFAAPVTYPGPPATDTSGAAVASGVTDAIVSVADLDGNAISSPGAVAHIAGGNPSVVYDAAAKGEAWITYSLTASGHTFSNVTLFCSSDPQTLASANTQATSAAATGASNAIAIAALPTASGNATAVWAAGARTITGGSVGSVTGSVASVTGNVGGNVAGSVGSLTGYVAPLTGTQTAAAVLDAAASSHNTPGTIGAAINTSGSANDPWTATLPGSYTNGQAGYIVGHNLDAAVSSRMPSGNVTVGGYASGQDPATLLLASAYLTIPADHTISGTQVVLTYKQEMALVDALAGGDTVQGAPVANGTATVTYYLRGAAHTSGNVVAIATVTYASSVATGRTVKVAQPFPAVN